MALVSPGVQVTVIDESFYTPAEPGTVPMIFVATKENKSNPASTGIAPGTLAANAGKVYLVSSQRELSETFGDPSFYTDASNNPIHGGEQNEYGLQAAYSYLGVANRAYVVRADLDLNAITASSTATAGDPTNGSYWFDTDDTKFGIFEWNGAAATVTNGQTFANKVPLLITDVAKTSGSDPYTPSGTVGSIGDYAVVAVSNVNRIWYKSNGYGVDHNATRGTWVEVGSEDWKASIPFVIGTGISGITTSKTITFSLTSDSSGTQYDVVTSGTTVASLVIDINTTSALVAAGITAASVNGKLALYNNGTADVCEIYGDDSTLTALGIVQDTYYAPAISIAGHTSVPLYKAINPQPRPTGSVWIKTTSPNLGAVWNVKQYSSATSAWTAVNAPIYATNHAAIYGLDSTGGGANIAEGAVYVQSNVAESVDPLATFKLYRKNGAGAVSATSAKVTSSTFGSGSSTFTLQATASGAGALSNAEIITWVPTGATTDADLLASAINAKGITNVGATVDSQNRVVISHALGGDIRIVDTDGLIDNAFTPFDAAVASSTTNLYYVPGTDVSTSPKEFMITHWKVLTYTASSTAPTTTPADGALWYSSIVDEVDLMIHNGTTWVGLHNVDPLGGSATGASSILDPNGPIVSATAPTEQSDGSALVEGDVWISTADVENYPLVYRWNNSTSKWVAIDKTDQTTDEGILFADARWSTGGGSATAHVEGDIVEMLTSNFLDVDAPDPALYPTGMLLWNLRRSGFNVKRFVRDHVDVDALNIRFGDASMANYYPHRWVTESANNADGSGSFGRNAQRKVVVQSLQAMVNSNQDIRDDESRLFNLIACPGYSELIGEMVTLNYDRGLTAFVVGDSPMRLTPTTTAISDWATNVNLALEDNDIGLVSRDEYLGIYYPSGYTSDNLGNNIVVPASHMVLRTIALNDQVAYPWFAPAGTRRGGVTNATATGYITSEGEFASIALNEGQRDTLYSNNVNPVTFLSGAGIVVYGQKTRARNASALDRVNVARLVIYLRSQLKTLAKPYIFEPNDKITRDEIKQQVESLMVELIGLRAIYDYLVVCDESNNTPSRIDRNELYVDIAIEPVKAVEFIYIPLRLKNTGEIAGL
tara:strand:+ start:403 stop:3738 length:3336 start_codon:yes stop_codon:yes gene_type:complete